ncbi:hypothetical protein MN608_00772 [Microdochium nivale]|nr:hypothetical protein MN608_00772 [Microdochium nivale]
MLGSSTRSKAGKVKVKEDSKSNSSGSKPSTVLADPATGTSTSTITHQDPTSAWVSSQRTDTQGYQSQHAMSAIVRGQATPPSVQWDPLDEDGQRAHGKWECPECDTAYDCSNLGCASMSSVLSGPNVCIDKCFQSTFMSSAVGGCVVCLAGSAQVVGKCFPW